VTWQRDALGRWIKTDYDQLSRPITVTVNYEDGNPLSGARDADLVSVNQYDSVGRVTRQIGNYVDGVFSATEPITDRITLYQYDTLSRVITTTVGYDPATLGTRTDTNRTSVATYDSATTRVSGQRDALGRWISVQYDALGRVTNAIQNCRTTQGSAVAQGCAPFDAAVPDRNIPAQMRYDVLGRAFETVNALGYVAHNAYDGLGRTVATTQNYIAGGAATSDTNVTTRTAYDALGRTTVITDAVGASTRSGYDGLGHMVVMTDSLGRVTRMGYDGTGALRWSKRNDGQLTVNQLDALGRTVTTIANYHDGVVSTNEPADQDLTDRTTYDAAGRRIQITDPAGRVTALGYDNHDRLLNVAENVQLGTCTQAPCNVQTSYQYDRAGNRTAIVDARGNARRFTYDVANQQTVATDPLNHTTQWDYDAGGRITTQHDPRGSANDLAFTYDGLDRITQLSASSLGALTTQYDALGRRTSLTDATGTTSFGYDSLGRMTGVTAPQTGAVGYSYNARGQRTQLTYPGNTALQYTYWDDGQLRDVLQGSATLASYTYDPAGRLQQVSKANGAATTYAYDDADRLRDLRTIVGSDQVSRFQYTLDRLGQRTGITETLALQTRVITSTYDGLARLTSATESPGTSYAYAYDLAGNRTDAWVNGAPVEHRDYDAANQVVGWQYDAAGNLLDDGAASYSYDALDRLTGVTQGGTTTTSTYNGDGVLVAQTAGGATTRYAQDLAAPTSQVLQIAQGANTTTYLYGADRLASVSASGRMWYGGDALGSVRMLLSDAGVPFATANYDPWGTPQGSPAPDSFGFTGELQDTTSGLVYLRARWYHPGHGSFTSRDSFAGFDEQPYSLHPYQYGYSNPQLNRDPRGQCIPKSFANYQPTGTAADVLGIVLAQLAQDDCDWIWNLGQGLNTQDGAAYAQSISEPWVQAGQAIYVLLTNREAQQAFADEYSGAFGPYKLGWEILKGLGQDIYNAGTDLGDGVACHTANTFGRGLSRVALFLGNFVAGKLAARGLGYLLKSGGAAGATAEETAVATAEESAASTAEESATNAADDAAKPPTTCSFSADTPVATDGGERPIGDLQVGDHVLAYDEAAGTTSTYTVTAVLVHTDPAIERLTVDGEQLKTTPEHPFFTKERGWVAAGTLWNGAHLRKADGGYGLVEDIKVLQQPQVMYNLTVARAHTFFVGQQRWLVHNTCAAPNDLIAKSRPGNSSRVRIVTGSASDAESAFRGIADPDGFRRAPWSARRICKIR
jgi:RHS repeat-associated protein